MIFLLLFICPFQSSFRHFNISSASLPEPILGHAAAIYNDTFTILQGWKSNNNIRWSLQLNPFSDTWSNDTYNQTDTWSSAQFTQQFVQINNMVYIIIPSSMFTYDLSHNTFSSAPGPPRRSFYPYKYNDGCAVLDTDRMTIYYAGGKYDGEFVDSHQSHTFYSSQLQAYNISNMTWSFKSSMHLSISNMGCAMHPNNSYLYTFGGDTSATPFWRDDIQRYSVIDDEWSILSATLSLPRFELVCHLFSFDNQIYCMGGYYHAYKTDVDIFDPITESVNSVINMHYSRSYFTITEYQGRCMIIAGGKSIYSNQFYYPLEIEYLGYCNDLC